eukprot:296382_1
MSILTAIFSVGAYFYFLYVFTSWMLFQINFKNQGWAWAEPLKDIFPYTIDPEEQEQLNTYNLGMNMALFLLWAFHHSTFARGFIKKHIPEIFERSLYVFIASGIMHFNVFQWSNNHVNGGIIYQLVQDRSSEFVWFGVIFSWLFFVLGSFYVDHFELVGLKQGVLEILPSQMKNQFNLKGPWGYKFVRHPMMTAGLCTLWLSPVMTYDRFVFSILFTIYVVIGVHLEEKDLHQEFGDKYKQYSENVPGKFFWCPVGRNHTAKKQN